MKLTDFAEGFGYLGIALAIVVLACCLLGSCL
jgi:hypothetical protein